MICSNHPTTWGFLLGILLACSPFGLGQAPRFTISPETTYFTEPRTEDDRVDYARILNEYHSRGVQLDDNAVVILYQASGRMNQKEAFFEALGVPGFNEPDQHFEGWKDQDNTAYDTAIAEPWTATDHPDLVEWLEKNEKVMGLIFEASLKNGYYSPWVVDKNGSLFDVILPGVQVARDFARAFSLRAMLKLGQGDTTGAWNDLMVVHRLGRLVARGPSLIERLVGISLERLAMSGELKIISAHANSSKLALYRLDLDRLADRVSLVDRVNFGERLMCIDLLTLVASRKYSLENLVLMGGAAQLPRESLEWIHENVDWDDILRLANRHYSAVVETLSKPSFAEQSQSVQIPAKHSPEETLAILRDSEKLRKLSPAELTELIAPWFVSSIAVSQDAIVRSHFSIEQITQNLLTAFALTDWLRKNGSYPDSLDRLTPEYLPNRPIDLFTGKPLAYERNAQGCRFFSIGPNSTDQDDDLVVELGSVEK
ncbi:MAG: hypothetical protein ACKOAU_02935 [Pirellula sp.]